MILPNTPPWGHMTQITIRLERGRKDGGNESTTLNRETSEVLPVL